MTLYLAGIVTPFVLVGLWLLGAMLLDRGLGLQCHYCQESFGDWTTMAHERTSLNLKTRLEFWWHKQGLYHKFMKRKHVGEVTILREAGNQTCL